MYRTYVKRPRDVRGKLIPPPLEILFFGFLGHFRQEVIMPAFLADSPLQQLVSQLIFNLWRHVINTIPGAIDCPNDLGLGDLLSVFLFNLCLLLINH